MLFRIAVFGKYFQIILYSLIIVLVLLAKYNENDQIKKNEMGRACSKHEEKRTA
jgi:hypothetical protein